MQLFKSFWHHAVTDGFAYAFKQPQPSLRDEIKHAGKIAKGYVVICFGLSVALVPVVLAADAAYKAKTGASLLDKIQHTPN